ncbi:hypothetical protein [Pseudonocardia yunnanensis]|uniref:Uncharacterized protein n=1 Tax=Pseudonocardia yunnanensis TaxID=58107 RepID=A0ABW4F0B8_9PSEU
MRDPDPAPPLSIIRVVLGEAAGRAVTSGNASGVALHAFTDIDRRPDARGARSAGVPA